LIIPYGHDRSVSRFPWLTLGIIAICTLVQIYSSIVAPGQAEIDALREAARHATTSDQVATLYEQARAMFERMPIVQFGYQTGSGLSLNLIASGFVHDGWIHLIGNMLFLWLVGSALEDRLGPLKFAVLYLAGDVAATYAFELAHSGPPILLVGASGAISAAMGAFLVYFARTEIMLWYWLMFRSGTFRLPAYVALPLWIGDQVLMASIDHADGVSQVAYAAHVGGFVFGVTVALGARWIWRRESGDDAGASDARAVPEDQTDDRYRRCMEAVRQRDGSTVRILGSRVILDLSRRAGQEQSIVDLYRTIANGLARIPLTDGAFAAVARAADAVGDVRTANHAVDGLKQEHPGSRFVAELNRR